MRIRRMFSKPVSPVVADFGASSVKLLQLTGDETPCIVAAAEIEIPDEARGNVDRRFAFLAEELPAVLRKGGFEGKRAMCSPASSHFIVQQTRIDESSPLSADDQVSAEVAGRMNCLPNAVVARSFPTPGSERDRVVLAIARDDVMRHVDLFKRCRFDLMGVQPDQIPMLHAFHHLHRRSEDRSISTMYVDAGWGAVKVAVARGTDLVFARIIQIGGRQFDEISAAAWGCTNMAARARRIQEEMAQGSPKPLRSAVEAREGESGSVMLRVGMAKADAEHSRSNLAADLMLAEDRRIGEAPTSLTGVSTACPQPDFIEVHETIADELSMCARYAQASLGSPVDRIVMLGGESHSRRFAGHLARRMGIKTSVGDPIRRLFAGKSECVGPLDPSREHPEWVVACGLCAMGVEA
jgi:Tfp pilus assembly PilM family ATPase